MSDPVRALEFDGSLDLARMRGARHARLVDAMRAAELDALLLLGNGNVAYATGARLPAADQARAIHRRAVALVTADAASPHLWTWCPDGVPSDLPAAHVHPGLVLEFDDDVQLLLDALPAGAVGVDDLTMPLYAGLGAIGRTPSDANAALGAAKIVKTADEVECLRRAQAINEAAVAGLRAAVVPGVTGTELTGHFLGSIFGLGATANQVDPIWQVMPPSIAAGGFSTTGDVVFPTVTTDGPISGGDVVWVDTGLVHEGYLSDYGHTWVVGTEPDERQRDQARRWRAVVDAVLDVTRPGATGRDLTRAARAAAGSDRVPWLAHLYLAHGSGTESAEAPFIGSDLGDAYDDTIVLEAGNVFVLEPVIWDDGHGGFRAEQMVAVTDGGAESLSHLTWDGWS